LAPVAVLARVSAGPGGTRVLHYTSTPASGRVVTFVERGPRMIVAEVTAHGLLVAHLTVAHYLFAGPPRLTRPRHLTATGTAPSCWRLCGTGGIGATCGTW
jgi:hypothetical protein